MIKPITTIIIKGIPIRVAGSMTNGKRLSAVVPWHCSVPPSESSSPLASRSGCARLPSGGTFAICPSRLYLTVIAAPIHVEWHCWTHGVVVEVERAHTRARLLCHHIHCICYTAIKYVQRYPLLFVRLYFHFSCCLCWSGEWLTSSFHLHPFHFECAI